MKKLFTFLTLMVGILTVNAQTLNIVVGDITYAIPAEQAGDMLYTNGETLTVMNKKFQLCDISRMYVDHSAVENNVVKILYGADNVKITVAGSVAQYIDLSTNGANVSIVQSELVGDDTCGEIKYTLSGETTNGSFRLYGSYKSTLELCGLALTNTTGAALDIQNGKRIDLIIKDGTINSLVDGTGGSQKGCIVCKGHLELKGTGTLNASGNTGHAIFAKEYIKIKGCSVNVLKAVKDGLNCNQFFEMKSGALNISDVGDDGLQISYKDETNRDTEDTGSCHISGGTITAHVTAKAAKTIKADGRIIVTDGVLNLTTSGGGVWDEAALKTKSSTCLGADGSIIIDGGTLTLNSTGGGGKGISCDSTLTINGGDITVQTTGGLYAYVNGTEYDAYTGNSDNLSTDKKSSPKGIKADGYININGGTLNVSTSGNGGEGIESKTDLTVNGGTIKVSSYDDGLNSAMHMYINEGDITVVATNNDALDSNGNMYIDGGKIAAFGGSQPECGLDANTEGGYKLYITGGTIFAAGGGNNTSPASTGTRQAYVTGSGSLSANATITLSDGNETLATFTVPENYTSSGSSGGGRPWGGGNRPGMGGSSGGGSILVSCAGLVSGTSYTLTLGTTSSSVTAK